jgi:hypothetical protein
MTNHTSLSGGKKMENIKSEKAVIQYQITFAQNEIKEWNDYLAMLLKRLQKVESLETKKCL